MCSAITRAEGIGRAAGRDRHAQRDGRDGIRSALCLRTEGSPRTASRGMRRP